MDKSPVLILLAGGKSSRMGTPKGLLDYAGKPWILEQISRFKYVRNPKVYIGLGYDHEQYFSSIPWFKKALDEIYNFNGIEVKVVINYNPENGPFSTLQTVLKIIESSTDILVQPIDVPLFNGENLISLINETNSIVIPICEGHKGHPVKLRPDFWSTLLHIELSSDKARLDHQIRTYNSSSITYLNVTDNSINQNINTLKNWNKYIDLITINRSK